MKTAINILIVFFSVLLIGCESNPTNEGKINSSIIGDWLWKSTSGGFAGTTTTPTNGNVHILKITIDSNFIEIRNDTITFTDKFSTRQYVFDDSLQSYLLIDFATSRRFNLFVTKLTTDSLILSDMLIDGYSSLYTRIK